jgi:hypothetical protein
MWAFLLPCRAFVAAGVGGYFVLGSLQGPTGLAYSTEGLA